MSKPVELTDAEDWSPGGDPAARRLLAAISDGYRKKILALMESGYLRGLAEGADNEAEHRRRFLDANPRESATDEPRIREGRMVARPTRDPSTPSVERQQRAHDRLADSPFMEGIDE